MQKYRKQNSSKNETSDYDNRQNNNSNENDNNIFKHDASVTEVRNILGPFGANLSALLNQSLGAISFYIPIVLFCWFIRVCVGKKIPNIFNVSFLCFRSM